MYWGGIPESLMKLTDSEIFEKLSSYFKLKLQSKANINWIEKRTKVSS